MDSLDRRMKFDLKADLTIPQALQEQFQVVSDRLQLTPTENPAGSFFLYDEKGLSLKDEELGLLHLDFINDHLN